MHSGQSSLSISYPCPNSSSNVICISSSLSSSITWSLRECLMLLVVAMDSRLKKLLQRETAFHNHAHIIIVSTRFLKFLFTEITRKHFHNFDSLEGKSTFIIVHYKFFHSKGSECWCEVERPLNGLQQLTIFKSKKH